MLRALSYRSTRVFGLAALALLFSAGAVTAQTGRIEGTVRDANTGDPVASAQVEVVGTELTATTNQNGYYAVEAVPVGAYQVRVSSIGYQQVTITNQRVAAGLPTAVNFTLAPSILRIEGVVVTGVAEAQQAVKLPFTVDQLKGEALPVPAMSAEESIRGKVAGARVVRGSGLPGDGVSILLRGATSISTAGRSNEPLYVVDGVILGASMVDIDALDIESIEVTKGAAASALYGSRAANGVVQITTRRGRNIPEGDTRIIYRAEVGQNFLQRDFPMTQTNFYRTDGDNWLDSAGVAITAHDTIFNADGSIFVGQDGVVGISTPRDDRIVDWVYNNPRDINTAGDTVAWDQVGEPDVFDSRYAISDNPYPGTTFDHMDRFFDPGNSYTHHFSISHRTGSTNFLASFHEAQESGVVAGLEGYQRRGGRLNVDHRIGRTLDFSASGFFSQSERDNPFGDNPNPFFTLPRLEPDIDLLRRYPAAQAKVDAGTATARDSADYVIVTPPLLEENPLYLINNQERTDVRGRFLASVGLRWRPVPEFDIEGNFSFDRSDRNASQFWFKGYRTFDASSIRLGRLRKISEYQQALNGSVTAAFTKRFGSLNTVTKARVLVERDEEEEVTARATDLFVDNVRDLDNSNADLQRVFGSTEEIRSLGYFLSSQLDLNDRYIVDALIRRDGSSLFGPGERWHWYYRVGGAYRMSQESWWPLDFLDEFKLRASQGTAGGRPRFEAQYETYSVSAAGVTKGNFGNRGLKPERAIETEVGVDMIFLGRASLSVTHARSTVEDQLLNVPLAAYNGFTNQWRNAGTLKTNTWEATLQASLVQTPDVGWNINFVWDRTRGVVDSLGTPPFFISGYHYVRSGDDIGALYGSKWATQCSDILHSGSDLDGDGAGDRQFYSGSECLTSQGGGFEVNDDGYLVPVGAGNSWTDGIDQNLNDARLSIDSVAYQFGIPVKSYGVRVDTLPGGVVFVDTTRFLQIGSSVPDFSFGFGQNLRWKGLSIHALFDAQIGGDIYNNTRQWGCRDKTCWEYDQVNQDGTFASGNYPVGDNRAKSILYGEILYDVNDQNSHFVEDGTFLKFRELSVRYTLGRGQLENLLGGFVKRISLSLIGRNLVTWSDYSGYDPEVSTEEADSAYLRVDAFGYPNFRTFTGSVELEF